jgi:hypothetical protein
VVGGCFNEPGVRLLWWWWWWWVAAKGHRWRRPGKDLARERERIQEVRDGATTKDKYMRIEGEEEAEEEGE